ncbi:CDP-diacylglycerol--serine O-phosphatidyltransferase [Psychrobacter sp. TAE2020]|uniref:CDP-diacylglycerol--serine O-phosphatidyltransferase n=1 Tax=Psychrobacter sp. TAE2020 TaxID=2846762 RepID=UPI001C115036|nr:CDP-diacylglycerol--serine O-phosphatidyltransferase [Psychrobacter sp. TAE2020]MBU5616518.1 CDP-diacylglycerol--serine O-phosphatidyltransferase [Psychrobacter sp. TAE2020]
MSTEQSPHDTRNNISDSVATQPPFINEHEFNIRLADNDNYDGLTFEVIETEVAEGKPVVSRGVYLAPNLITTLSLLSGFFSILASTRGDFYPAALAIFLSAILDGADGRVARMLNAQSPFGEQYDSLADMLAFGVAPAILVYSFALEPLGRIGIGCAFVFTACGAFRLARFNVQVGIVDKKYFVGLASPLAAILVTAAVMVAIDHNQWIGQQDNLIMAAFAAWIVICGLLMVSNVKYYSFKEFDKKKVPFVALIIAVLVLSIVIYDIPVGILAIGIIYALSGIVSTMKAKASS